MANYLYTIQNANLKNTGINRQPNIYFGIENGGPALFDIKDAYVNYSEATNNPLRNDQITGELHQVVTVHTTTNRIGLTTAETIVKRGLSANNLDVLTGLTKGESVITSAHHETKLQANIVLTNTDINESDLKFYAVKIDSAGHIVKASTPYSIEQLADTLSSRLAIYFEAKHGIAQISSNTITRPKNSTLSSISWTGGSAPSTINSGSTGTLTKGTVTGTYGNSNGTATITTSGIEGDLTIESNDVSIITIGPVVKNGNTTINGIKGGNTTITVKDGNTTIQTFNVTVNNEDNLEDVTNSAIFRASAGSISGTTITAPTVTADTTVTITCTYGGKQASQKVTYTAKTISTTTYKWYVGYVTNSQFENSSSLNTIVTNNGTSTTSAIGSSRLIMPTTITGDVLVYIYPTVWGTPTIVDSTGYGTGDMSYEDVGLTPPAGYKVRFWDPGKVEGKTLNITWVK